LVLDFSGLAHFIPLCPLIPENKMDSPVFNG
jgi:hypothetical protein